MHSGGTDGFNNEKTAQLRWSPMGIPDSDTDIRPGA
jgi:hypothetical protein